MSFKNTPTIYISPPPSRCSLLVHTVKNYRAVASQLLSRMLCGAGAW